jgi:hypothetical protein
MPICDNLVVVYDYDYDYWMFSRAALTTIFSLMIDLPVAMVEGLLESVVWRPKS